MCLGIPAQESEERARNGESFTIRLKVPDLYPAYNDLVYGSVGQPARKARVHFNDPAFEDPILLKSDGLPTYHLANVVDDHAMHITHVIRAIVSSGLI